MIVREHFAPIVGRISMDLTLVDVTGLPGVSVGDEVVLLGALDGLSVDAREHAELADTNVYEFSVPFRSGCHGSIASRSKL